MRIKHVGSVNPYHLWAHQTYAQYGTSENWARSSNTSFEGNGASSYSTVIARRFEVTQGKGKNASQVPVFLMSNRDYSVTTAKHKSFMRSACRNLGELFEVPNIGNYGTVPTESGHKENVDYLVNELAEELARIKRARKYTSEARALTIREQISSYVSLFSLPKKWLPKDATLDGLVKRSAEIKAQEAKEERERAKKAVLEAQKDLTKWLAGERVYRELYNLTYAYLRVKPTGESFSLSDVVETSRRADVPMAHIARVLPIIMRQVRTGTVWARNGSTIRLGYYQLDAISADGTVKVGCHVFQKTEILRFAEIVQKWIEATGYNRHTDTD